MEKSRFLVRAGVDEDPNLAAGILLSTSLLGLVTYIWAFWSQFSHVKKIRGPLIALICVDIINLITGIIVGSGYVGSISVPINWLRSMEAWLLTRSYGVILHLLTSAWCLLCLSQPQQKAKQRYTLSLVFILICVMSPVYVYAYPVAIYILGAIIAGLALGVIANFVSVRSPSAAKEKKLIMTFSMCIFWVVFFPSFVLECLTNSNHYFDIGRIYVNVLFFTNFQLFFNGLLCFTILKLSTAAEENEQQQQQQQPSWQQPAQPSWQQPAQPSWQQPAQPSWQQPAQPSWQQPAQRGWENPGFGVSVFTVGNRQNSN